MYSLFSYGTIQTSEAKAKAIKGLVDQTINLAKKNPKALQPLVQSFVLNKNLQDRIVKEIAPKFKDRTSGYTQVVKMGTRPGDQTMMVKMSLIGMEELKPVEAVKVQTKKAETKTELESEKKVSVKKPVKATRKVVAKAKK